MAQKRTKKTTKRGRNQRSCLLVLGMHRSGTSALTRVLNMFGAALPRGILGAGLGNETGHWEPEALVSYHEAFLEKEGSHWHDWQRLKILPSRQQEIARDIRALIEDGYKRAPLFVVKDPRICRFVDVYREALNGIEVATRPVLIFRNPLDVIESLRRRAETWGPKFTRTDAALLWLRYLLDAERQTRGLERVFVTYDNLLKDWRSVVEKVEAGFDLDWLPLEDVASEVDDFISPEQRHHIHKSADILLDPLLRDWVGEAWSAFLILVRNPQSKQAMARLDRVFEAFDESAPVIQAFLDDVHDEHNQEVGRLKQEVSERDDKLVTLDEEKTQLQTLLGQREQALSDIEQELVGARERILSIEEDSAAKMAEINLLKQMAADKEVVIGERDQALAEKEAALQELQQQLEQAKGEAGQLEATLAKRGEEIASLREELEVEKGEINLLERQIAEKDVILHESDRAMVDKDRVLQEIQQELEQANGTVDQLNATLTKQEKEIVALKKDLEAQNRMKQQLAQLKQDLVVRESRVNNLERIEDRYRSLLNSTSWRITAPIRFLKMTFIQTVGWFETLPGLFRYGGGVVRSAARGVRVFFREGFGGLRLRYDEYIAWENRKRVKSTPVSSNNLNSHERPVSVMPNYERPRDLSSVSVSVIIPCYNDGHYLWDAVASAISSYSGMPEIIIVNDGSDDSETLRILKELPILYPTVKVENKPNGGLASARNAGIACSTGDFIQFLDADDLLAPGKIDAQLIEFFKNEDLEVSLTNYFTSNDELSEFYNIQTIDGHDLSLESFLFAWEKELSVPIHTALFRRIVLDKVRFPETIYAKEDWIFWCDVAALFSIEFLDFNAVVYRLHGSNMTQNFEKMGKCWVEASDILKQRYGEIFPEFVEISRDWHTKWYLPRIALQKQTEGENEVRAVNSEETEKPILYDCWGKKWVEQSNFSSQPIISVLVPIFNHYEYLHECLFSLLKQGDVAFDVILSDDCSTDCRVHQLLDDIDAARKVKILRHSSNIGISENQNAMARVARGEYIAFLDCDDFLEGGALKKVLTHISNNPDIDYFFSDRRNVSSSGQVINLSLYESVKSGNGISHDLMDRMIASHLKVMKREPYLRYGLGKRVYSGVQDWDTALRFSRYGKLHYIPDVLYNHRVHDGSHTFMDVTANLKKSNMVRREHLEAVYTRKCPSVDMLRNRILPLLHQNQEKLSSGEEWCVVAMADLSHDTWYCPKEIHNIWDRGVAVVFDARGGFDSRREQFIKEFNSSFDLLIVDSADVGAHICGSLWSPRILVSPLHVQ